jgi:hypothetical protein
MTEHPMTQTNPKVSVVPTQADREAQQRFYERCEAGMSSADLMLLTDAFARHRLAHQTPPATQPTVGEVEYEVWQADAFGDGDAMVAGSTDLKDAFHYAAVYGQDGPAWVVEVTRKRLEAATLHTPPPVATATVDAGERSCSCQHLTGRPYPDCEDCLGTGSPTPSAGKSA